MISIQCECHTDAFEKIATNYCTRLGRISNRANKIIEDFNNVTLSGSQLDSIGHEKQCVLSQMQNEND